MKAGKQIGILMVMLLVLTGCGEENLSATLTSTIAASETALPTATETPVPTNTQAPMPTEALSETGPWLAYGRYEIPSLMIRDGEGIETENLAPPEESQNIIQANHIAPTGGQFALIVSGSGEDVLELRIHNIPGLEIKFRKGLFSTEALALALDSEDPNFSQSFLYLYYYSTGQLKWSADGRYLAFVSIENYPEQQVIVYDSLTGEEEVVLEKEAVLRLIDWSPNGENLLFYSGEQSDRVFNENGFVSSVNISSGVISTFGPTRNHSWSVHPLGWFTETQVVVIDYMWEGSPRNLRLLDLNIGKETILYSGRVGDAALDPVSGTLVFDIWSLAYMTEPNTEPKEMQVISYPDVRINTLPLSGYTKVIWHPSLGLFSAENSDALILFDASGKISLELPRSSSGVPEIFPSPDGEYLLVETRDKLDLITLDKEVVQSYSEIRTGQVVWLSDSNGFYWIVSNAGEDQLFFCSAANGWQPELIETGMIDYMFLINQ